MLQVVRESAAGSPDGDISGTIDGTFVDDSLKNKLHIPQ